ncbi:hypothetical protein BaRGS_00005398, partial [Batillaria attramentaria]
MVSTGSCFRVYFSYWVLFVALWVQQLQGTRNCFCENYGGCDFSDICFDEPSCRI